MVNPLSSCVSSVWAEMPVERDLVEEQTGRVSSELQEYIQRLGLNLYVESGQKRERLEEIRKCILDQIIDSPFLLSVEERNQLETPTEQMVQSGVRP